MSDINIFGDGPLDVWETVFGDVWLGTEIDFFVCRDIEGVVVDVSILGTVIDVGIEGRVIC